MSEKELKLNQEKVAGNEFDDLSKEEMNKVAGANGDVNAEITPTVVVGTVTLAVGGAVASYILSN